MSVVLERETDVWQLQQAKARFSEVVNYALNGMPQLVTRSGRPSVYIVSAEAYEHEHAGNELNRKDILLSSPTCEIELDTLRDKSDGREVAL